jgi:hypothetical protein
VSAVLVLYAIKIARGSSMMLSLVCAVSFSLTIRKKIVRGSGITAILILLLGGPFTKIARGPSNIVYLLYGGSTAKRYTNPCNRNKFLTEVATNRSSL